MVPRNVSGWRVGFGLVLVGGIVWILFDLGHRVKEEKSEAEVERQRTRRGSPGAYRGAPAGGSSPVVREALLDDLMTIERERNRWDKTVWAEEVISQKFGEWIVGLWDRLKGSTNKLDVLAKVPFGRVDLGRRLDRYEGEDGVREMHWGGRGKKIARNGWRDWIRGWKAEGYRIDQTEWRHVGFVLNRYSTARSEVEMTLHVRNSEVPRRAIVHGRLGISWKRPRSPKEEPFPKLIRVLDLSVTWRDQGPTFEKIVDIPLTEGRPDRSVDPLLVQDLNGDRFSDFVLAGLNRAFVSQEGAQWAAQPLHSSFTNRVLAAVIDDVGQEGVLDLLFADPRGVAVLRGKQGELFHDHPERLWRAPKPLRSPFVIATGDIDADGDLDLWLPQYCKPYVNGQMPTPYYDANDGFPAYLLKKQGDGQFVDITKVAGLAPKRFRRTYSSSFFDMDQDNDLDLLVVSDFAGVDLYRNDGTGRFTDITESWVDERHLFGMAHTFGDFDRDGRIDLFVTGMTSPAALRLEALGLGPEGFSQYQVMRPVMAFGNRLYLQGEDRFRQPSYATDVADTGWSWGTTSLDWDNDGDRDLYVVNGHTSRRSTQDYDSRFWRHDIYAGESKTNRALELYFQSVARKLYGAGYSYGGYEKNRLLSNRTGRGFLEMGYLLGVSIGADCRNVIADDVDRDGRVDLIVRTDEIWPQTRQRLIVLRNQGSTDRKWIGIELAASPQTPPASGARVECVEGNGLQVGQWVTGDSYRAQHHRRIHFGLGSEAQVTALRVIYPGGRETILEDPKTRTYHVAPWSRPEKK